MYTKLLLVSYTEGGTWAERVRELGAEGDIWAEEGRGNRGVELHDLYSPNIIRLIKSRRRGAENVARTGRVFW